MEVKMTGKKLNTFIFQGTAFVSGQVVAEAEIQAAMVERDE
jgi:3-hydroxymyristoyl/3-hydroxydecanoyl-(acyl carrier protein) dehydratase